MAKILIVEDDIQYQQYLKEFFEESNHEVVEISDNPVEILMNYRLYSEVNLLITDYMMPTMNGVDFIAYYRRVVPNIKVIMLTALEEEEIELEALDVNVDCFLNKKMSKEKFLKYVEKVLERPQGVTVNMNVTELISKKEKIHVNLIGYEVRKDDNIVELTNTEYNLLVYLLRNMGRAVRRKEILESLWEYNAEEISERIVDSHIKTLRRKLQIHCIQSIRGIGYKWDE